MHAFKCDLCGELTYMNPPFEKVEGEEGVLRQQEPMTGVVRELKVPAVRFLKPKTRLVYLQCSEEKVQRDFCDKCYSQHIKPLFEALWAKLAPISSQ